MLGLGPDWTRDKEKFLSQPSSPHATIRALPVRRSGKGAVCYQMDQDVAPDEPAAKIANYAEIVQAIEALTDEDSERLEEVAVNRIVRIGRRAANGRTDVDLLQETMARILDGPRHWYPDKVKFVPYLVGVVWSIASEWAGQHERKTNSPEYAVLESEITKENEEGEPVSPFASLKTREPNIEQQTVGSEIEAERKALADEIEAHFSEDENASYVLMGWQDGMDGPAIQKEFGFSETTYRAIVRRIRRNSQKIMEKRYGR